jgi:predicted MFS family arabinose efflux permease
MTSNSPLRDREFRWLVAAAVQSLAGDQLARVGLSVLVFSSTGSPAATSAVYALTFLPGLASVGLGHLADRYPRRRVMVTCDLTRAALLAVMAVPAVPLWLVCVLLAAAVVFGGPFQAASTAVVADIFTGAGYRPAVTIRHAVGQLAQVAGFGVGGVLVATIGARGALGVDAATFAMSAAIIGLRIRPRAAAHETEGAAPQWARWRAIVSAPGQWSRLALIALLGCWIVPEALAAPYAAAAGGGDRGIGLLLAAMPAGFAGAAVGFSRGTAARARLIAPLAATAALALVAFTATPALPVAVVLLFVAGAGTAYLALVMADYINATAPALRGQAAGLSSAVGLTAQGIGAALGGAIAQAWSVGPAIGLAGAAGLIGAAAAGVAMARDQDVDRANPPS